MLLDDYYKDTMLQFALIYFLICQTYLCKTKWWFMITKSSKLDGLLQIVRDSQGPDPLSPNTLTLLWFCGELFLQEFLLFINSVDRDSSEGFHHYALILPEDFPATYASWEDQ